MNRTPGTWRVDELMTGETCIIADDGTPGSFDGICILDPQDDQTAANAALMAAAPDLLQACEALLHTEWSKKLGTLDEFEVVAEVLEQAREAIRKARGAA